MKTLLKEKDVEILKNIVTLKVIENKGAIVNNKKLPTGCKYCELKWEQKSWV